jgi:hypothetical protein
VNQIGQTIRAILDQIHDPLGKLVSIAVRLNGSIEFHIGNCFVGQSQLFSYVLVTVRPRLRWQVGRVATNWPSPAVLISLDMEIGLEQKKRETDGR